MTGLVLAFCATAVGINFDTNGGDDAALWIFSAKRASAAPAVNQAGPLTVSAASGPVATAAASATVPPWVNQLNTPSIKTDMIAAFSGDGTLTFNGLVTLLTDIYTNMYSTNQPLTSTEFAGLQFIATALNNSAKRDDGTVTPYLAYIFDALVNGNPANATWTGGEAQSTSLGDLKVGSSALQLDRLIGKWFEGRDLPSSEYVQNPKRSHLRSPIWP